MDDEDQGSGLVAYPPACFYLGGSDDSKTAFRYPSPLNRCKLSAPPETPSLDHQNQVCFKPAYKDCPVYSRMQTHLPRKLRWRKTLVIFRRPLRELIAPFLVGCLLILALVYGIQAAARGKPIPLTGVNLGAGSPIPLSTVMGSQLLGPPLSAQLATSASTASIELTPTRVPFLLRLFMPRATSTPTSSALVPTSMFRLPTPSYTPTFHFWRSVTSTATSTLTPTVTMTRTATITMTVTMTRTITVTVTSTLTPTVTMTLTATATLTPTLTPTRTLTPTPSHTPTVTRTPTATLTPTITLTPSITPTPTITFTPRPTRTPAPTNTKKPTPSPKPSQTPTPTQTFPPTQTPTSTDTQPPTPTATEETNLPT